MFTACTTANDKHGIITAFSDPDGIAVATVAFGMGLDSPNVRGIIRWGPSSDMEQFLQEIGRAGRDGLPSHAIWHTVYLTVEIAENMKEYYI